jgi:hypothetical protein
MAFTFANIASLLIPAANEMLENNMRPFLNRNKYNWYMGAFQVQPTGDWTNSIVSTNSTRLWPEYTEGAPLNITQWGEEDESLFDLAEYQDGFEVTRRYLKYGDAKTAVERIFPRLAQKTRQFAERGLLRHSQLASLVFSDAFAGAIHTGIDGLPLFHNAHPLPGGLTYDNLSNLPLSDNALNIAWDTMSEIVDEEGVPLDINYDTIIVGPRLERTVFQLLENSVKPGANNDERNFWPGQITRVIVNPWWVEQVTAGSSAWWALQDSNVHTLKGFVGEMPTFLDEPDIDPMKMTVLAITSGVYGWHSWQGMYGSNGGS